MKLTKLCLASVTTICVGGLSACTTVDLSQVAVSRPQAVSEKPVQNIVERASRSLTSMFHAKGWCKSDPEQKTKTATNVLLNGMDSDDKNIDFSLSDFAYQSPLSENLADANFQVEQTTKAAEVYLTMADDMVELDKELSQLEAALLSAREAEAGFRKTVNSTASFTESRKLRILANSVDALKTVTDAYGDRIRSQIAARASAKRS